MLLSLMTSACIERVGQSRKMKKVKRERENGKVIDKRERKRERREWEKEFFHFFCF